MGSVFSAAFYFVLTLGLLVTFHEFGHYWVARRLGVKVLRFSVGFGKPIWSTVRGADRTEYVIAALPLGGYVKMLDEREGPVDAHEQHRAFNRIPLLHRSAIVLAGPVFNFVLAIAVYWVVFMLGVNGLKPIVGEVIPDSVAEQGGIVAGDQLVAINGVETPSWNSAVMALLDQALASGEVSVTVVNEMGDQAERTVDVSALPASLDQNNLLTLVGISPAKPKIPPRVGQVEAGSPASKSDLRTGDLVLRANDEAIEDYAQWVDYIRARPDQTIAVEVDRDGARMTLQITPERKHGRDGDFGRIGAGVQQADDVISRFTVKEKFGPIDAMGKAVMQTWDVSVLTLRMLYNMVAGEVSLKNLSGPLSIAQYAGGSASIGLVPFLMFLAIVSVSLGVLNLLPIPVLDGGHLMYYIAEAIRGRPVSESTEILGQRIGVAMILGMMVLAFYNDLIRIFGF